jgi:hypothetical protein
MGLLEAHDLSDEFDKLTRVDPSYHFNILKKMYS